MKNNLPANCSCIMTDTTTPDPERTKTIGAYNNFQLQLLFRNFIAFSVCLIISETILNILLICPMICMKC